jgi:hypothetical protein
MPQGVFRAAKPASPKGQRQCKRKGWRGARLIAALVKLSQESFMKNDPNYLKNLPEVTGRLKRRTDAGPQWGEFAFDTGVLGDILHDELVATWHLLPEFSRNTMLTVVSELYMNSHAERLSDEKAAEIVRRLRGGM